MHRQRWISLFGWIGMGGLLKITRIARKLTSMGPVLASIHILFKNSSPFFWLTFSLTSLSQRSNSFAKPGRRNLNRCALIPLTLVLVFSFCTQGRHSNPRVACSRCRKRIWASEKQLSWVLGRGIELSLEKREGCTVGLRRACPRTRL